MRRPYVAGNWKLHLGPSTAASHAGALRARLAGWDRGTVAVFPTALSLPAVAEALAGSVVGVGVQEIESQPHGAYTGANSAVMAREVGCDHALVGHSERRRLWAETDARCAAKLVAAFAAGLLPIYCVGETLAERRAGRVDATVFGQLEGGLASLAPDQVPALTIAYEPVWAIGTGVHATPEQAQQVHASIRAWLREHHGDLAADTVRIQYGGSVTKDNAPELLACPDIDGALVGGASLDLDSFVAIVEAAGRS
jgi:triosephosphate isomerase (TIM)